jgi:hypothetical protein
MCIRTRLTSALELVALPKSNTRPNSARIDFLFISYSPESKEDYGCSAQNTLRPQRSAGTLLLCLL